MQRFAVNLLDFDFDHAVELVYKGIYKLEAEKYSDSILKYTAYLKDNYTDIFTEIAFSEIEKGWFALLDMLLAKTKAIILQCPTGECSVSIDQIKEKYGALTVYMSVLNATEFVCCCPEKLLGWTPVSPRNPTSFVSNLSDIICMECGAPGTTIYPIGWVFCLCEEHRKEHEERAGRDYIPLEERIDQQQVKKFKRINKSGY
jgi:hypothetical protein